MKNNICNICINEDFGYCGLRNKELQYENDENGDLIKCSGFSADKERINSMYKLAKMKARIEIDVESLEEYNLLKDSSELPNEKWRLIKGDVVQDESN